MITQAQELFETVIKNGYCIGCGICATLEDSPFSMELNNHGMLQAHPKGNLNHSNVAVLGLCPFSSKALSEDQLSKIIFADDLEEDPYIGKHLNCYVASINNEEVRSKASSGGIGRWVACELIKKGMADYFVHVKSVQRTNNNLPLFEYNITSDAESIINTSKSAYYPVTLDQVLRKVRNIPGSYIVTGVPCFVKSIRLLTQVDNIINDRIKYTIGIVCGSLKTNQYASCIAWEQGVHPNDLCSIDFRKKYLKRPANHKGNEVISKQGSESRIKSSKELFVTDYGMGFFKPKACEYCDDVVAELADISIGDAWLSEYTKDPKGNSIIIVRNNEIDSLIKNSANKGEVSLVNISKDKIIESQAGGFRHRREGLSYRLLKKTKANEYAPPKRVEPSRKGLSKKRRLIYDLREEISNKSQTVFAKALEKNSIELFFDEMNPLVKKYRQASRNTLLRRVFNKIKRMVGVAKKY